MAAFLGSLDLLLDGLLKLHQLSGLGPALPLFAPLALGVGQGEHAALALRLLLRHRLLYLPDLGQFLDLFEGYDVIVRELKNLEPRTPLSEDLEAP